jgi:hypothetical protein
MWRAIIIPGALAALREARGLSRAEAAKRLGISLSTLYDHERGTRDGRPISMRPENEQDYEIVYMCQRSQFLSDGRVAVALREALELRGHSYEVLTPKTVKKCCSAIRRSAGMYFAATGTIIDFDEMDQLAASSLGGVTGEASRFRLVRHMPDGNHLDATLITKFAVHTDRLMECADSREEMTVIVRVVLVPELDGLGGYQHFGSVGPITRSWAFVVEEIISSRDQEPPGLKVRLPF